ncbi:hypothetical protein A2V61_04360 [Candidatus Woesebacteria bacterium RBG_19FT_COMBO_47_8]|uniref:Glycosyl transferase family 1 domain-containing protein n=1 Tax=Candidatus Woesebacteria bacterium RBG_13_46_13 TaxID=1802479 RepID=A0A1F7X2V8_9BACT|nr:MAG: hypothetical protein A2Y68_00385 [Candidatus Woesebacteria bacterium RBG_13_46_13]OGM16457.1 MAG: hypothetical protein A2V61_04360 [Candidatus Woesebacteria bacterium RBG_19FT_COMBO_47_8]HJX59026.1 glycosyltransferase family 4 protein [Patescibacteria group bacterium]
MRAAIYNPYLDTLGGGERYSLAVATVLQNKGYKVDVQWRSPSVKNKLEDRFGIKLTDINFVKDIARGDGYDLCFWVSDGSIPALKARKNLLHFQVPFHGVKGVTLLNKMKLWRISKVICNSRFTKSFIDAEYGVDSAVIYPPVAIEKIRPKIKEDIITFVGRFSQLTQAKNQDVLIKAFKRLYDSGYSEWKLILAGGAEIGGKEYLENIKKISSGYPIEIVESPTFKEICTLYGRAKIFWSAVGFGAKEEKEPEKFEHFGISAVEAMAAGAAPLVYRGGGYKEIVREGENGFLWASTQELLKNTRTLIETKGLLVKLGREARLDSKKYSYDVFAEKLSALL